MSTCEVRLFIPKGCFRAYVSGMTVVGEILLSDIKKLSYKLVFQIILFNAIYGIVSKSSSVYNSNLILNRTRQDK
jgi:hypothetical protein